MFYSLWEKRCATKAFSSASSWPFSKEHLTLFQVAKNTSNNNHIYFRSSSRFGAWKCRHNNRLVCKPLRRIFKDSMPWTLNISHTFENPALIWSWEAFVITVVNTTAFFFCEGVWRHGIFVSRWNLKERVTHVSRKSCIIQQIRWRLRSSWSVSTFIQSSVGWD